MSDALRDVLQDARRDRLQVTRRDTLRIHYRTLRNTLQDALRNARRVTHRKRLSRRYFVRCSREDTEIAEMPRRDGQESNYFESEFQMKPEMKSIWMAIVSRNLCDDAECIQKQQEINCLIELRVFEQQIDE